MLQGVQEVRTQIDVDPRMLDWDFVDGLVEVLEDLASLTTKMQKEVYLMGDFFRDLYLCREDLDNRTNKHVPAMIRLLNSRTNVLLSTVTYSAAIVCDPRFNTYDSIAITTEQREDAIVSIHNTFFLYIIPINLLLQIQYYGKTLFLIFCRTFWAVPTIR